MNDLQRKELEVFEQVAAVCEKHGLRYYALGGTLLGTVRHQGFIPWDDDIDLAMPRPDYDRFMRLAPLELPENLRVTDYRTTGIERPTYFCVVKDLSTRIDLNWAGETEHGHVWIDIFPLDPMPSLSALRSLRKYRLLYQRMMVQFSNYDKLVHQHRANRPAHEKALMAFHEKTGWGADKDTCELYAQTERIVTRRSYDKAAYVVNLFGAYKFREMFPRTWFGEAVKLPFEDTLMPVPREYDLVLRSLYGDYLQMPPEEERGQQHCMTVISLGEDDACDA